MGHQGACAASDLRGCCSADTQLLHSTHLTTQSLVEPGNFSGYENARTPIGRMGACWLFKGIWLHLVVVVKEEKDKESRFWDFPNSSLPSYPNLVSLLSSEVKHVC